MTPSDYDLTLGKEERIKSRKLIEQLFKSGKSRSMTVYPLRMVYMVTPRAAQSSPAQMMVSVPKRCFKRAVKRNRVKRQVREAYRHHRQPLYVAMRQAPESALALAFIWLDNQLRPTEEIFQKTDILLRRLSEKLLKPQDQP